MERQITKSADNRIFVCKKKKNGIKKEHALVLSALENANLKHNRLCLLKEVIAELDEPEKAHLNQIYAKSLSLAVSSILILLAARDLIMTVSTETKQRFFGSKRVLENFQIPEIPSRRRKVLALVEDAVNHHKKAVRIEEVLAFAQQINLNLEASPRNITSDIIGLVQTGELKRIEIEAFGFRGNTFYLLSGLSESQYTPSDVSNWLEKTYKCFQAVWQNNVEKAKEADQKPAPVTTGEVRRELYIQHPDAAGVISTKRFINMLLYLSTANTPKLKKVNNPNYNSSAWLPADTASDQVLSPEHFYASDAERVEEAVRRVERIFKHPANIEDAEQQISTDDRLKLKSSFSVARMLNNAAKLMTVNKSGGKVQRKVKYVGSVDGRMYYTSGEIEFEQAEQFVSFWKLKSRFEKLNCAEEIKSINLGSLPLLKYGRLHLLESEIQNIRTELHLLNFRSEANPEITEADEIKKRIAFAITQIEIYKNKYKLLIGGTYDLKELLQYVSMEHTVGLIASEVMKIVYPFYPTARKLKKDHQLVTFFHDAVKRIRNPDFKNRFSKNPKEAAEYLFDRTELLTHTALKWGNRFAHLQSLIARQELGALRNPKFIFPLLKDRDFTVRLKAAACLAFMSGEEIEPVLDKVIKTDVEPNVRRVAEWSLAVNLSNSANLKKILHDAGLYSAQ